MAAAGTRTFGHPRITVIDVEQAMVDTAWLALAGFPDVKRPECRRDVAAVSFDIVKWYLMLHHLIDDWQDALSEVSRVMKPVARSSATTAPIRGSRGGCTEWEDHHTASSSRANSTTGPRQRD